MRILIVDDDLMTVEFFIAVLESDGHVITVERDGPAGESRALKETFDLILLDVQVPGRSGIDVCRNIRRLGVRTPIVALSASVFPEQVARTKEAGFDRFIAKPIAPAELRATVRAVKEAPP